MDQIVFRELVPIGEIFREISKIESTCWCFMSVTISLHVGRTNCVNSVLQELWSSSLCAVASESPARDNTHESSSGDRKNETFLYPNSHHVVACWQSRHTGMQSGAWGRVAVYSLIEWLTAVAPLGGVDGNYLAPDILSMGYSRLQQLISPQDLSTCYKSVHYIELYVTYNSSTHVISTQCVQSNDHVEST